MGSSSSPNRKVSPIFPNDGRNLPAAFLVNKKDDRLKASGNWSEQCGILNLANRINF